MNRCTFLKTLATRCAGGRDFEQARYDAMQGLRIKIVDRGLPTSLCNAAAMDGPTHFVPEGSA